MIEKLLIHWDEKKCLKIVIDNKTVLELPEVKQIEFLDESCKQYISADEAAKILGVTIRTFNNLRNRGMAPEPEVINGRYKYKLQDIKAFKESLI